MDSKTPFPMQKWQRLLPLKKKSTIWSSDLNRSMIHLWPPTQRVSFIGQQKEMSRLKCVPLMPEDCSPRTRHIYLSV